MELGIDASSLRAELGQPILLRGTLSNSGEEACYVELSADLGEDAWSAKAVCETETVHSRRQHFDSPIEDHRLSFVPLGVGHSLSFDLPPISGLLGLSMLDLLRPGACSITVSFSSRGSDVEGYIWPIWRGRAESSAIQVAVIEPSSGSINSMLSRLQKCLEENCEQEEEAFYYFRMVRDKEAASLLRQLLPRMLFAHPAFPEAIANQGDEESLRLLEKAAREPGVSGRSREYILDLVEARRRGRKNG
jgi:hypothetical protein